ncbi:MAG: hypothetical protein ABSA75_14155 [Candidatus Bathyarchaeia archaeon]
MKSEFGWVKIDGVKYESDIIIHANEKITKRKKKLSKELKPLYGHTPLSKRELDFLENEKPEAVYVGTGHEAALPITPEALSTLQKYNAVIEPTPEIIKKINNEKRKFTAIIHVTC